MKKYFRSLRHGAGRISDLGVLEKQVAGGFNVIQTTSTGRILDAAAALLGNMPGAYL